MPMPDEAVFTFTITFARGKGDPRRVFDAASLLIAIHVVYSTLRAC
jgi:hypothetical protein